MKVLEKIERSLEQLVEGVPRVLFRHRLQPAELGRALEREMMRHQQAGLGAHLVPNDFRVGLAPDDFEPIAGFRGSLENQMESWLTQAAQRRQCMFVGPVSVSIMESAEASRRGPAITCDFVERAAGDDDSSRRRGGRRGPAPAGFAASLVLLDDGGKQRRFIVPSGETTIGRSPENDIVLTADDVSRHHARIEADNRGVRLHDLRSTNGTRVNGETISQADLFGGDMVQVGRVRMRLDVHADGSR